MSGTRMTRRVTVEGGKKVSDVGSSSTSTHQSSSSSYNPRRSVFERLGPGAVDRSKPRDTYQPDRCRNWLRDGHCPYGNICKFLHGPFTEPKQRTKTVRSVVSGSLDRRSEESDERPHHSRTRSLDSVDFEDEEAREIQHKQKKHRTSEEEGSDSQTKKAVKVKKRHTSKHAAEVADDQEDSTVRKRKKKAHKKRDGSPSPSGKLRNPKEESGDWSYEGEPSKPAPQWEEQGEQLALEKRRQDLQRQLALIDEQDAAAEEEDWTGKEVRRDREEDHRKVPVLHSKLHPSAVTPPTDASSPAPTPPIAKKKKKKRDSEGKVKVKKDGSPRVKEEGKRKTLQSTDEEEFAKKREPPEGLPKKGPRAPMEREKRAPEEPRYDSPPMREEPVRKRTQRHFEEGPAGKSETFSPEPRAVKPRHRGAPPMEVDEPPSRYEEGRPRKPHDQRGEYYKSRDQPEEFPRRDQLRDEDVRDHSPSAGVHRRGPPPHEERGPPPSRRPPPVDERGPPRARRPPPIDERSPPPARRPPPVDERGPPRARRPPPIDERSPPPARRPPPVDERTPPPARRPPPMDDRSPPPARRPPPIDDRVRGEEGRPADRGGRRELEPVKDHSRGPRTPSPDGHPRGRHMTPERGTDRFYDPDDIKTKAAAKGSRQKGPRTPPGEPSFDDPIVRVDRAGRGVRSPASEEERGLSPPTQPEGSRSNRFSERDRELPQRHRDPEPANEPGYPDRGRGSDADRDYERRNTRDDNLPRGRKPVEEFPKSREEFPKSREEFPKSREEFPKSREEFPKSRGRDESFERGRPREGREDEFARPREREARDEDFSKKRNRDDRPEDVPRIRGREEPEFSRPRNRDERDEGRPPRDNHRRPHEDPEGHERDSREERDVRYDRDERDSRRPDVGDNRGRERQDRSGDRGRESRYTGPPGTEYHRRPSPSPPGPPRNASYGPPRGRSPPPQYDDRRRSSEGFRGGPGRDNAGGRGRGGWGRGGYNSPHDSRGKPGDMRRRTPPPVPPRPFHDRGPPSRGRDGPPGRGRGYVDNKGRGPPGERFRDQGASWDRRPERDVSRDRARPHEEPRDRDRRPPHESPPPPPPPGFREQKGWDERRENLPPPRSASPHRRAPYEGDREGPGRGRPVERDLRRPVEGEQDWGYDVDNPVERGVRKRARPAASSRSLSPFEPKKPRSQSVEIPDIGPPLGSISPAIEAVGHMREDALPEKKTPVAGKEGKKIKKKKEGKKSSRSPREGAPPDVVLEMEVEGTEEGKVVKVEKKVKKEKKIKEKGAKKKGKKAAAVAAVVDKGEEVPTIAGLEEGAKVEEAAPEEILPQEIPPVRVEAEETVVKAGKKRKHAEGEPQKGKDGEKLKKKKKKKHQPEVNVQPWADLEGDDEQPSASEAGREKSESVTEPLDAKPKETKGQDEMFSDWSDDDSPGAGDDSWPDNNTSEIPEDRPKTDESTRKSSASSPTEPKGPSFDDVYDPISDDEFEAMYTQSDEEGEEGEESGTSKAPIIEDVDWSSIGLQETKKEEEPGAHLQRFKAGHVFSRIGISPGLAGPRLTQLVQNACANSDKKSKAGSRLFIPVEGPKCLGAYVAAMAARKRQRDGLLADLGPCRRALCARRDLAIRKQLGRTSSKLGKVAMFSSSPTGPVDRELFQMSVALYKKDSSIADSSVRIVPSKLGSILLSQA